MVIISAVKLLHPKLITNTVKYAVDESVQLEIH